MKRPSLFHFSFFLFTSLTALLGCQSYTIVQRNVFADDDGNVVSVEYGHSESDHVKTVFWPATGKEVEHRSKLMVRATFDENVPDFLEILDRGAVTNRIELSGQSFKAWGSMPLAHRATTYRTDNDEWILLASGFSCTIYRQIEKNRYLEVFRGVLCEIDDSYKGKKDERWKTIPKGVGGADR